MNKLYCFRVSIAVLTLLSATTLAPAQILTTNGGFEAGFTGWTFANQLGSEGSFAIQSGTTSPVNGTTVPAPTGGIQAAMTDAQGPGSHVLYQDFVVPSTAMASVQLHFDVFIGNRANAFFNPTTPSLDFSTPVLNQQARVDILLGSADPFSVLATDVLLNALQTAPGNPLVSGYTTVSVDVTAVLNANLGNTLRLRFAEVDNVATFQMGLDNVAIAVPEPSSFALLSVSALAGVYRWRRRATITRGST